MKNTLLALIIIGVIIALPTTTFAATFQYVDTNGNLATVTADNAAQALLVPNLGLHSGVMLVTGVTTVVPGYVPNNNGTTYIYVDINGNLKTVVAANAAQALMVGDLGPHSGVMLIR